MAQLDDLHRRLLELDEREEDLRRERAAVMRAFVRVAGGVTEAAGLLELDPRAVVQLQRLDGLAMVIYRGAGTGSPVDADGRVYGETGQGRAVQRLADGRWWRVAKASQARIRLLIVVDRARVTRIWPVKDGGRWEPGDGGKYALPLGDKPLTAAEVAERYPDLGVTLGDERPMRQGLLREYIPIDGATAPDDSQAA
jgi:hypothetical protein